MGYPQQERMTEGVIGTTVPKKDGGTDTGNKGTRAFALSTTTLNASTTTDVDLSDVEGSVSDVESALRCRVVGAPEGQEDAPHRLATTTAVNVCYQPDATDISL